MTEENLLFYELKEEDGDILVDISEQLSYAWEEEEELDDDDFFSWSVQEQVCFLCILFLFLPLKY